VRRSKFGAAHVLGGAHAPVCGAQRHMRAWPAVRLPRRFKLVQGTGLGLVDIAAQAACQPARVCGRALSGRRPRPAARTRLDYVERSARREAAASRRAPAGACSYAYDLRRAGRMPAGALAGWRAERPRPHPAAHACLVHIGHQARLEAAAARQPRAGDCCDPYELRRAGGARAGAWSGRRCAERPQVMAWLCRALGLPCGCRSASRLGR